LKHVISAKLGFFELIKEQMPDVSEAYYDAVKNAVYNDGALDLKTKRLIKTQP
jgi:alkylhydroperoxidase/carboxymuconolactone decarboxylase family protein YurZ